MSAISAALPAPFAKMQLDQLSAVGSMHAKMLAAAAEYSVANAPAPAEPDLADFLQGGMQDQPGGGVGGTGNGGGDAVPSGKPPVGP